MTAELSHAYAVGCCPESHRLVLASAREEPAIRAERNRSYPPLVADQRPSRLSVCRVPQPHQVILPARCQQPTIWAERGGVYSTLPAWQTAELRAVLHVPESHR